MLLSVVIRRKQVVIQTEKPEPEPQPEPELYYYDVEVIASEGIPSIKVAFYNGANQIVLATHLVEGKQESKLFSAINLLKYSDCQKITNMTVIFSWITFFCSFKNQRKC